MLQRIALAVEIAAMVGSASALESQAGSTMLDMGMYQDVMFAQIASMQDENDPATKPENQPAPVCTLKVHTVKPTFDVPKVPSLSEMPSFLKRRLARRYQERGEPVPDYLKNDVVAQMKIVKQAVN